jgi:hypothetical protein
MINISKPNAFHHQVSDRETLEPIHNRSHPGQVAQAFFGDAADQPDVAWEGRSMLEEQASQMDQADKSERVISDGPPRDPVRLPVKEDGGIVRMDGVHVGGDDQWASFPAWDTAQDISGSISVDV